MIFFKKKKLQKRSEAISILVVCIANYCRSPVAEVILKKRFGGSLHVSSAGISPFESSNMDQRSRNFLIKNGYEVKMHNPRRVNRNLIKRSSIIFATDLIVLDILNKRYKKYKHKIRLLSLDGQDISLRDPFKESLEEYNKVMKNIEYICNNNSLSFDEI